MKIASIERGIYTLWGVTLLTAFLLLGSSNMTQEIAGCIFMVFITSFFVGGILISTGDYP
jgi:hypothetical protein